MVLKCTHNNPVSFGGNGLTCNLISVINANVPSEPAIREQKLKSGPPAVNGAISTNRSTAYPVFRRSTDFFGNSFLIST